MRTKQAIKNTSISAIAYIFIAIIGFFSQKVFKDILGVEYLGLHSLFSNIMTMLALAELGFGTAIISNMYKPVAENNQEKILALLQFYKKIYHILAVIILVLGFMLTPFIDYIIGKNELSINLKIVFSFYLFDTVFSYCLTYKRSILYAYQKNYYTNLLHSLSIIIMNITQIIVLKYTNNYYLYLILRIIFRISENISINFVANKLYPFIKCKKKYTLDKVTITNIIQKIKGLFFHKIGSFFVLSSDNIIISILPNLGLKYVGLYSNYLMITNQLSALMNQVFQSITSSVGNLLIENDNKKIYATFKRLLFFNGWIYIYVTISFYMISKPFISLWMGKEFLFNEITIIMLSINFFIHGIRSVFSIFKEAAGIFYEDRYVPIIESIVNIGVSIILGYYLGLVGVFIGTICSNLVLFIYSFPKFVYQNILKKDIATYIKDIFKWLIYFFIIMFIAIIFSNYIRYSNNIIALCSNILISFIISNALLVIFNKKNEELKYYKTILKKIMLKIIIK